MKSLDHIPQTKIQRASKLLKIGAQVSTNYVKYLGNRVVSNEDKSRKKLNEANATDIYDGLSELKGSALKMAQMMSMDDGILPKEYVEKFSLAQFRVPPLSGPLARKTFKGAVDSYPEEAFTQFKTESSYAASIGQVHEAWIDEKKYAVKIQYPGVAKSIVSDLRLVKPIALRILKLKKEDVDDYFNEVQEKLLEETNYIHEKESLIESRLLSKHLKNIVIPEVNEALSSRTILTMEWMDGLHLSEYVEQESNQEKRNQIAQALWDFFQYHIHVHHKVHADPHPGNFKVNKDNKLVVLDFGCMKEIPFDFYQSFFKLAEIENINNDTVFLDVLKELQLINNSDTEEDIEVIKSTFRTLLTIINKPYQFETFDFSDPEYFKQLLMLGNELIDDKALKNLKGKRGSRHFLYVNRTLIGLLGLMNQLQAGEVVVQNYKSHAPVLVKG
ncbi:MAG: AarF/UbiB family protein [Crocinitomicaceae bacterium]|nr:AarF/UbiB family protein [Crocinitomicaceae bacterium]|tara:strand:+ start:2353 stop:3684 length:1332 start_codon:yes stop_codon:yes gene_type:complete